MSFITGMIAPVPTANKQAYLDHVHEVWPLLQRHGAQRLVECWGEDVPTGKITDMMRAVAAKDEETIVFTWIEWPDRATCDAAWPAMQDDPDMAKMTNMPFDGARMIYGGFGKIFDSANT